MSVQRKKKCQKCGRSFKGTKGVEVHQSRSPNCVKTGQRLVKAKRRNHKTRGKHPSHSALPNELTSLEVRVALAEEKLRVRNNMIAAFMMEK